MENKLLKFPIWIKVWLEEQDAWDKYLANLISYMKEMQTKRVFF